MRWTLGTAARRRRRGREGGREGERREFDRDETDERMRGHGDGCSWRACVWTGSLSS